MKKFVIKKRQIVSFDKNAEIPSQLTDQIGGGTDTGVVCGTITFTVTVSWAICGEITEGCGTMFCASDPCRQTQEHYSCAYVQKKREAGEGEGEKAAQVPYTCQACGTGTVA